MSASDRAPGGASTNPPVAGSALFRDPTPRPAEGVVSWNVNTACNYRCAYCTQRAKDDRGRPGGDPRPFLDAFARLPGPWEVKLSGGEPFVHPGLDGIASGLARLGHRVSVVTNFSADRARLEAFARAASGRVGVFSCSLHLQYVADALDDFFDKASWFKATLEAAHADSLFAVSAAPRPSSTGSDTDDPAAPPPSLCVTLVAARAVLPLLPGIAARARDAGVSFKVQPEKQDRDVIRYTEDEKRTILAFGGHNLTGEIIHRLEGRPCWAGARYFILDDEGRAFRCYPARRYRLETMGNFLSPDFDPADGPAPCRYQTCNCTVPIARGMMPLSGVERAGTEEDRS